MAQVQAIAPKNTDFTTSAGKTTIKFSGDVAEFFKAGRAVMIANRFTSDSKTVYQTVVGLDNKPARLLIDADAVHDDPTDVTTLVVLNPDALVLQCGVATGSINAQLRVMPFDYKFEVSATTTGAYEEIEADDIYALPAMSLAGENFLSRAVTNSTIVGTIHKTDAARSPSGQYMIIRALERTTGNCLVHWFGSADYGKTFTECTSTRSSGYTQAELNGGYFTYWGGNHIVVADNGKFFSAFAARNGSNIDSTKGIYGNLQTSFAITDVVGVSDAGNNQGTGYIYSVAGGSWCESVAADRTDLSFIAVACKEANGYCYVRWYTNGGANHSGLWTTAVNTGTHNSLCSLTITGSDPTHRTMLVTSAVTTGNPQYVVWDQATGTTPYKAQTQVIAGDLRLQDVKVQNDKIRALFYTNTGSTFYPQLIAGTINGATSWDASLKQLSVLPWERFNGYSPTDDMNSYKTHNKHLVINPSNDNHVCIVIDQYHPDTITRATLYEICDVTNYLGVQQFNRSSNAPYALGDGSALTAIGQTITGAGDRLRTASILLSQVGTIPSGYTLTMTLQATTAGLPNGTIVATSVNSYDPSKITRSSSCQWLHFNFPTTTLTNGVVYAIVITKTYPQNSSNYLYWAANSSSVYPGGNSVRNNGSAWAADSTYDMVFEINGEYVTDIGQARQTTTSFSNVTVHDQESQIELIDSASAAIVSRRATMMSADTDRIYVGHPFRRVLSFGTGGAQSTLTAPVIAGYAPNQYDANLVFNVALGNPACSQKSVTTGLDATVNFAEDRSGFSYYVAAFDGTNTPTTDSSFISPWNSVGYCQAFNGSNTRVVYGNTNANRVFDLVVGVPFVIEAEINCATSNAANNFSIISHWNTTSYSWSFSAQRTGYLAIQCTNAANVGICLVQASDMLEPTGYHRVRCVYDGTTVRLYRTTGSGTTFTEVASYSSQQALTATSSSANVCVGALDSSTSYFNGKIGYVKFAKGVSAFNYEGFRSQPPITGVVNLGTEIVGEYRVGNHGTTAGQNYIQPAFIPRFNNQAVVDSNDLQLQFTNSLTGAAGNNLLLRMTLGRGSSRNASGIQGIDFQFSK